MAKFGGIALKSISLFFRVIQFLSVAVVLAVYAYFLATLSNHDLNINTNIRAVAGISGAAVIYTVVGFLFVCCLGGIAVLGFFSIILDLAFAGAFGYVAWVNRAGTSGCSGIVNTPYGRGDVNNGNRVEGSDGRFTTLPSFYTACRLQTAAFAVAIVAIVFFIFTIPLSLGLIKHHRKEKAFGPSPNNGYTAGTGRRRFWQRKPKHVAGAEYGMSGAKGMGNDTLPTHATPTDMRTSYATDTTAVGDHAYANKYAAGNPAVVGQPGYNNRNTAASSGTF